ncbi:hypothetical protein M5K25_018530 [Dendrobium thyrsiflorum]|uniref:Uncharacterized protein n=1 Tax=Dendrobium thyrsiflorum TaxID=117978 RepID=A0ABD0UIV2_DENTH
MPVPPFPLALSRANTISYHRLSFSRLPQLLLPPSKPTSSSKSLWRVLALQLCLNFKICIGRKVNNRYKSSHCLICINKTSLTIALKHINLK